MRDAYVQSLLSDVLPATARPRLEAKPLRPSNGQRLVVLGLDGQPVDARLVKILEGPAGQQFAPSQRLLESAIAVGYVFQLSGRSRDGLEDHADLHLRIRG